MPLPADWRAVALEVSEIEPARTLGSADPVAWRPWQDGWDPADPVDRAVQATRKAVFPLLGLDPHHD
jgi:acetoin utilization protein AcuC